MMCFEFLFLFCSFFNKTILFALWKQAATLDSWVYLQIDYSLENVEKQHNITTSEKGMN